MRLQQGFTVLEILCAVSIIGILAAVLLSSIARNRMTVWQAQSLSNMRQIGAALHLYTGEHGGEFPRTAHSDLDDSWIFTLSRYLDRMDAVRVCPADPRAKERLAARTTSYVLNEYIAVPLLDPFGRIRESFTNVAQLTRPSETITVFVGADSLDTAVSADHTHSRNWRSWRSVLNDIQPDRFRIGSPHKEHIEGLSHYLYADGHVETHPAFWLRAEIDAKRNPARPPE